MALKMKYKDQWGNTNDNAYWVITDMDVFKKLNTTEDKYKASFTHKVEGIEAEGKKRDWQKGYYVHATVSCFKDRAARDANTPPLAIVAHESSKWYSWDQAHPAYIQDQNLNDLVWDTTASDGILKQLYDQLKKLDLFKDAVDAD